MQVQRQFIDVKQRQVVIEWPASFLNHRIEVIAMTIDQFRRRVAAVNTAISGCGL